jgi:hypothetical protein
VTGTSQPEPGAASFLAGEGRAGEDGSAGAVIVFEIIAPAAPC